MTRTDSPNASGTTAADEHLARSCGGGKGQVIARRGASVRVNHAVIWWIWCSSGGRMYTGAGADPLLHLQGTSPDRLRKTATDAGLGPVGSGGGAPLTHMTCILGEERGAPRDGQLGHVLVPGLPDARPWSGPTGSQGPLALYCSLWKSGAEGHEGPQAPLGAAPSLPAAPPFWSGPPPTLGEETRICRAPSDSSCLGPHAPMSAASLGNGQQQQPG